MRLGRENEALESAWIEFCQHPSTCSYDDLMKFVRKEDRPAWHEKAIEAAVRADRRSMYSLIGLLIQTKEIERLAELVGCSNDGDLQQVSHYALEPAARSSRRAMQVTQRGCGAQWICALSARARASTIQLPWKTSSGYALL